MLIRLILLLITQQVMCRPAGDDTQDEGTTAHPGNYVFSLGGDTTGGLAKKGTAHQNGKITSASTFKVGSKPPTQTESAVVGNSADQNKPTGTPSASTTGSFQSKPPGLSQNGGFSSSFLGTSGSMGSQKPSRPPFSVSGGTQLGSSFNIPEMFYNFIAGLMQAFRSRLLTQSRFLPPSMMFGSALGGSGHPFGGSGSSFGGSGSSFGGLGSSFGGLGSPYVGSGGPFGGSRNPFGGVASSLGRSESSFGESDSSFGGVGTSIDGLGGSFGGLGTSFDGLGGSLGGLGSSYGSEAGHLTQSAPAMFLQQDSIGNGNTLPPWLLPLMKYIRASPSVISSFV